VVALPVLDYEFAQVLNLGLQLLQIFLFHVGLGEELLEALGCLPVLASVEVEAVDSVTIEGEVLVDVGDGPGVGLSE